MTWCVYRLPSKHEDGVVLVVKYARSTTVNIVSYLYGKRMTNSFYHFVKCVFYYSAVTVA